MIIIEGNKNIISVVFFFYVYSLPRPVMVSEERLFTECTVVKPFFAFLKNIFFFSKADAFDIMRFKIGFSNRLRYEIILMLLFIF
jgi:hypothetical protein